MTGRAPTGERSLARIFVIPATLQVLAAIGLVAALVGDGPWDAVSWAALGVPLAVIARILCRR